MSKDSDGKKTNGFDVIIAIIDFFSNLISMKKIISICVLYVVVIQNIIFLFADKGNIEKYSYQETATSILMSFFNEKTPMAIVILGAVIVFLVVAVVALIIHTRFLRKEINRLVDMRSELMHGNGNTLSTHNSSKEEK